MILNTGISLSWTLVFIAAGQTYQEHIVQLTNKKVSK